MHKPDAHLTGGDIKVKISEFAKHNQITAKMLRHYDDIGLLKPAAVDQETGYRVYDEGQSIRLSWILVLKNLDYSLAEIKVLLEGPVSSEAFLSTLRDKRKAIANQYNMQIQKRLQIDKLIQIIEAEGFKMEKSIELLEMTQASVHELKKNMPNTEMFLEEAEAIVERLRAGESFGIFRIDLCQFKTVNDIDGFEVGDKVILATYQALRQTLEAYGTQAAVGRAGGDEFVGILPGDVETLKQLGNRLTDLIQQIDFVQMGCHKQMAIYFGAVVAIKQEPLQLRYLIDDTFDSLMQARQKGAFGSHVTFSNRVRD